MIQLEDTDILATNEGQFFDLNKYKLIKSFPVFEDCKPGESKNSLLYLKERGLLIGAGMIGIFIFEIPEIKYICQYDGLFFCTVFCPNQFCELRDGKILSVSGDDDGGTGSFFVFSLVDGEFRHFNKDKIIRTLVRLNENKFAIV